MSLYVNYYLTQNQVAPRKHQSRHHEGESEINALLFFHADRPELRNPSAWPRQFTLWRSDVRRKKEKSIGRSPLIPPFSYELEKSRLSHATSKKTFTFTDINQCLHYEIIRASLDSRNHRNRNKEITSWTIFICFRGLIRSEKHKKNTIKEN